MEKQIKLCDYCYNNYYCEKSEIEKNECGYGVSPCYFCKIDKEYCNQSMKRVNGGYCENYNYVINHNTFWINKTFKPISKSS